MTDREAIYADRLPQTFSVPDRCRAMGLDTVGTPDAHAFVSAAGAKVREAWISQFGVRPNTELTRKSSGGGTHHKARYPWSWVGRADAIIRKLADEMDAADSAQLDMFGD